MLFLYYLILDSVVYEKVCNVLLNKKIKNGICQASPLSQTSCLEGFHSVLNHFSPKMILISRNVLQVVMLVRYTFYSMVGFILYHHSQDIVYWGLVKPWGMS